MTTATRPAPADADAANNPWRQRALLAVALVLLAGSWYFIWAHFRTPSVTVETMEKRPLLKRETREFHDTDVGIRLMPPPRWSMQARTTEAPDVHRGDRLLVKFKRLLPNAPAAWFRVHVADTPAQEPIAESVMNRDPGPDWKVKGRVETVTVAGLPAARIQYGGRYNGFASLRDIIGVRRGSQVFYFVSTYQIGDRTAQEQAREAMNTVLFETR
jgi:hypothetical protein